MAYTYGITPSDVVTDQAGNTVADWRIDVYDSRIGGTRVTDLEKLDGTALPGYIPTDSEGRYEFRRASETIPVLWADDGQSGDRWALVATEVMAAAAGASENASEAAADASAAQQSAADAAASADAAAQSASTADAAMADLTAYQQQTPTLEELAFSTSLYYGSPNDTAMEAQYHPVWVAPLTLKMASLNLVFQRDNANIPASDTDYYVFDLLVRDATGTENVIATRTTEATGGNANGAIVQMVPWTFSGADLTLVTVPAGDMVIVKVSTVGSPPLFYFPAVASGTYLPA